MFVSLRICVLFASEKSFANPHPRVTQRRVVAAAELWRKRQMITKETPPPHTHTQPHPSTAGQAFPSSAANAHPRGGSLWMMCHDHPCPRPQPPRPPALAVACQRKINTHLRRRVPCRPPVAAVRNDPARQLRPADRRHVRAAPAARRLSYSANSEALGTALHPRASFPSSVPRSNTDGNEKLFIGLVRCISVVRNF